MHKVSPLQVKHFQTKILDWYAEHQRDLPWRKTRDPYRILLSEIMLQQTQVSRVIPKYDTWLERFPTIRDLAAAPVSEVLQYWSGLGYNRRALNLKKTAQIIVEKYGGKFPQTEKELLDLPGIGQYTARAVLCFAFDQQVSVVDVNVKKVILIEVLKEGSNGPEGSKGSTLLLNDSTSASSLRAPRGLSEVGSGVKGLKATDKEIADIADQLLPHGQAYDWNQALMDYSSMMLRQHKIPIPKQSKFKDSRRYYRGQVLKYLLEHKKATVESLSKHVKKEEPWVKELLEELEKEGFLNVFNEDITLSP